MRRWISINFLLGIGAVRGFTSETPLLEGLLASVFALHDGRHDGLGVSGLKHSPAFTDIFIAPMQNSRLDPHLFGHLGVPAHDDPRIPRPHPRPGPCRCRPARRMIDAWTQ